MIRFSIRNPVVVNLLAISVVVVGIFSFINLPREVFPHVSLNWIYIITTWPGASPEEMERLITIPIEEEVAGVDKIASISSRSYEGRSVVSIKFETVSNDEFRSLLQDVRTEVDQVKDLPVGAEDPFIFNFTPDDFMPLINIALTSSALTEDRLSQLSRDLKSKLKNIKGVNDVSIIGEREPEVWVEIDPDRLSATGISLSQVVEAVSSKNIGVPVGSVDLGKREYLIRMIDNFTGPENISRVIIGGSPQSGFVTVGDVAKVTRRLERRNTAHHFNGKSAASLMVTKNQGASTLKTIEKVRAEVDNFISQLPEREKVDKHYTNDSARQISGVLSLLETNAIIGMILVVIILYFFLGFRNALFAALGIPITFMVTFIFLHATGESFNSNSLFGLVLVLGVVVDDAIIVIENCFRHIQNGLSPIQAAYTGTMEVVTPIVAATATTIAAFLPLMLMPGIVGQFLQIVPVVVSLALLASLLEAFLVLPSHIAEWSRNPRNERTSDGRRAKIFKQLNRWYVPLVSLAIRRRYYVTGGFLAILASVPILISLVGVEMFRDEEIPSLIVQVRMPSSVRLEETELILSELETALNKMNHPDILSYSATAGFMQEKAAWYFKSSVGQIQLDLKDNNERSVNNDGLIEILRREFRDIIGPVSIDYMKVESGPPTGAPLEVKIKGKYLEELDQLTNELKAELSIVEGLFDVRDDYEPGKPELRYSVDAQTAARLGLNPAQVARELLIAFEGVEATSFRDGDEEIGVIVKFDESLRHDFRALDQMKLVTVDGRVVALSDATKRTEASGVDEIRRFNQDRAITISGENNPDVIQLDKIAALVQQKFDKISPKYPGTALDFQGEWKEFETAFGSLKELFVVGILLIYMILGAQFKSFLQPLIILFTIPFAVIGAVVGLIFMGAPFSIATMYGIVALAGVAVNDALVLVDFVNKSRLRGAGRNFSLIRSGKRRLRPILSTSITTIFGLLPMALGIGGHSVIWGPLATTIVWGLTIATFLTLFVIPALYAITDDLKTLFGFRLSPKPHNI